MGNTWKLARMMENIMASCLEVDQEVAIGAFVDQVVDIDALVLEIGVETITEVLGESLTIDKVYTEDEVAAYVYETYGVDILNQEGEEFNLEDYKHELAIEELMNEDFEG